MMIDTDNNPALVFVGSAIDALTIQSLLEEQGIISFVENELMGSIAPWIVGGGGSGVVKVLVGQSEYEKSVQLINDLGKEN